MLDLISNMTCYHLVRFNLFVLTIYIKLIIESLID